MRIIPIVFLLCLVFPLSLQSQTQSITNIQVSQRTDGSGNVDVYFNLTGPSPNYYLILEVSFNNGGTYNVVPSTFLSGNYSVTPGTSRHLIWNGKGSNDNTYSAQTKVKLIANIAVPCGQSFTINHLTTSGVAPVNKSATYGTVTNIPGEPLKCWITSNLGSDHQALSFDDATEASAGWYWQFNRKLGYKVEGTTITPSWTITSINENSDWMTANDPCAIELGSFWRVPSYTEWYNVDNSGGWASWNGSWNSGLKLHAAGVIWPSGYFERRGLRGYYLTSTQNAANTSWKLQLSNEDCQMSVDVKALGFSLRCIKETCSSNLGSPSQGTNLPSPTKIIWNWNAVTGATGYKWNTINNYSTAIDLGSITTRTELGLTCNTFYTRYVWAYNSCGNSTPITLTQSTSVCSNSNCGQSITVYHIAGEVAPVNKTVVYGTVENVPGEATKCWITQNLGADFQATAVNDATEASAGWYWQFNKKQGYKYDGTRIPGTNWILTNENSDWLPNNDPCALELGPGWHIPTSTEWTNVDAGGNWNDWNGPWNSLLKLHAAGHIYCNNGNLYYRGNDARYSSSSQFNNTSSWLFNFGSGYCEINRISDCGSKSDGFSVRCLRD
jgi:hypothetical protein